MNKILFDKEDSLVMNIVQKCLDKLPGWDDVTRNIPFIVTGSVGIAFVIMSRAERRKQQERERQFLNKKLKKDNQLPQSGESRSDLPIRQIEEEEEKKDSAENGNKGQSTAHHFQTEKTEDKTPQSNMQRFAKKNNLTNKKNMQQENDSGSGDDNDSDNFKKLTINQQQNNNNAYMNNSEFEFFNSQRYSQNEDDEEERFDKVITNDQVSEASSNHYMKSQVHKEKKQKRAPIKINRNFATDTENNEKFQKLKSIVQKEKKIEDKVFFQMFLNIVGTEADEDNDD